MLSQDSNKPYVLVIGAGISGIHSALELAEAGCHVTLIDQSPAIGGVLSQLDHQFPSDHCGMCRMLPMIGRDACRQFCLRKGLVHENIEIQTSTTVTDVTGTPGKLTVTIAAAPAGVDQTRCTECGKCDSVCPVEVADEFNEGLNRHKAIYKPVPHQSTVKRTIDFGACTRCGECEAICPEHAIDLSVEAETRIVEDVSGVIYTPGARRFDPSSTDLYEYGIQPNVVTATGFERMLNSIGPFEGKAVRPSDGQPLGKIAWLQCVGSRNVMINADHCSTACCMFAVKEAVLAHQKLGHAVETTIFYMDMRTFGRDFQRYRDRAEKQYNVRFVRCRVHSVEPTDQPGDLKISYVDQTGKVVEEVFDLAVLSTGQTPDYQLPDFAKHEGVEVIEAPHRLKDISESVIQSGISAGRVLKNIYPQANFDMIIEKTDDPNSTKRIFSQRPRFLVMILEQKSKNTERPDRDSMALELSRLAINLFVSFIDISAETDIHAAITDQLKNVKANRLIVAGYNPDAFQNEILHTGKENGLPRSLIELVSYPGDTIDIAELLRRIEIAVNRLRTRSAINETARPVEKQALVVGGGPAGLSAAQTLTDFGISVNLVEKNDCLGGNGLRILETQTKQAVDKLISDVENNPRIKVHLNAGIIWNRGAAGRFVSRIRNLHNEEKIIIHGAAVIATGGQPAVTTAYGLDSHEGIISQFDLEKQIDDPDFDASLIKSVVMIQCAGSREEPDNFCSRICCLKALNNAIALKEKSPDTDIRIFYRDIMTTGDAEKRYTRARRSGILFIPFDVENKPAVTIDNGKVCISAHDPVMGTDITLEPNILALSTGLAPNPSDELSTVFGLQQTVDGFIEEADYKWRPVDTLKQGIFVAGLARAPQNAIESMKEGQAAAYRAFKILSREALMPQRVSASVRHAICSKCELCIETCPYDARFFDAEQNKIMVDVAACQGCGACAAICPNSATVLGDFEDHGIMDVLEAALL